MFTSPCRFGYCRRSRREESLENLLQDLSGVWLGFHSWNPYLNSLQKQRNEKKIWSHKLILRGFVPGDIKVTTADDVVRVHARHVQESKNGNTDIHEATRNVKIPKNVDTENLKCRLDQNNVLLIEGPFIDQEEEPAPAKLQQKCDASGLKVQKNNGDAGKENKDEIEDENKKNCGDHFLRTEEKSNANADEKETLMTDQSNGYNKEDEDGSPTQGQSEYTIGSTESDPRYDVHSLEGDLQQLRTPSETPGHNTYTTDAEFNEYGKFEDQLVDDEADDKEFEILQSDLDSYNENEGEETPTLLLLQNDDNEEIQARNSADKELGRNTEIFQISLDIHNYPPENISVVRKDNSVTVKAEKKGERDGMEVSEQYVTQYSLPSNVNADKLSCVKNSEGKLVVTAPYLQQQ